MLPPIRKRIDFDPETYRALDLLALDTMTTVQQLVDEAIVDLLRKKGRPANLREALKLSLRMQAANDTEPPARLRG